jgi:hypothetical protein
MTRSAQRALKRALADTALARMRTGAACRDIAVDLGVSDAYLREVLRWRRAELGITRPSPPKPNFKVSGVGKLDPSDAVIAELDRTSDTMTSEEAREKYGVKRTVWRRWRADYGWAFKPERTETS